MLFAKSHSRSVQFKWIGRCFALLALSCGLNFGSIHSAEPVFDTQVAPLLAGRCLGCHGAESKKGDLDLSQSKTALAGGQSGKVIVPGKPDESLLWDKISADEMPPKKSLTAEEKATLKAWLLAGAKWGADPIDPLRYSSDHRAGYDWWSLQPVQKPALPDVKNRTWMRNGIDSFILAKLESRGLAPATEADRRTYIRRLSFDLLGLPPSAADVAAFEADRALDADEQLVQRYLDSPAYGERWARHWLDVVRFGESQGFERDKLRQNSWRYRDWLVWALNRDMPYDEFVRLQIAGDVVAPHDPLAVIATGYLVAAPWDEVGQSQQSAAMRAVVRQDELEDVIGTTAQTFLGLTANCARCHDHKFDPISQREYYQLAAAFGGVRHGERESLSAGGRDAARKRVDELEERRQELAKALASLEGPIRDQLRAESPRSSAPKDSGPNDKTPEIPLDAVLLQMSDSLRAQWQRIEWHRSQIEAEQRLLTGGPTYAVSPRQPEATHVLTRGNPGTPAGEVASGGIHSVGALSREFELPKDAPEGMRRIALANWMTEVRNPLTARVVANRLWHYHFGVGIVDTPNDLGFNGARPSHPELLDWLAAELVANKWSLKSLHRTIVLSATYRQGGQFNAEAHARDADNRLLWRKSAQRLEAEAVRDAVLAVTAELNPTMGGPGYQDFKTFTANSQFYEQIDPLGFEFQRRSLYRMWVRSGRSSLLDVLDCPDPSTTAPRRAVTTTPLQALALLNNAFLLRMCDKFAERIQRDVPQGTGARIDLAYQSLFQRQPTAEEQQVATEFVDRHGLPALIRVLLNSNEFLYID